MNLTNQVGIIFFNAVRNFVSKFREQKLIKKDNQKPKQVLVGHTKSGINVFKAKISDAFRLFFSYVSHPDFNSNEPFLLIRKVCHTNDQDDVLKKICKTYTSNEKEAEFKDVIGQEIHHLDRLDVSGPLKPVAGEKTLQAFEDLFDPNNICLD